MLELFPWMCRKRSYLSGERVTFENASQDSEYDSGSDEEERESAEAEREDSLDLNANNRINNKISSYSLW